ncbi:stealth conserved region 3 domain-containing protein [Streptomyces sp. BH106]|uniref:stealth conserved region 3 domain-containing protein n=1 Tax=Streptomyces sp. BH106 TaxID=3410409 RepID=UPI003CEE8C84
MKITFLLTSADGLGGTQCAILTQASGLARRHEVEVIGVFRTADEIPFEIDPRIKVRHLVDDRGEAQRPLENSTLDEAACSALQRTPSRYVERRWEPAFNALADAEVAYALGRLDSEILVTSTPALLAYAAQLTPAHVALVAQEHRISELRGATGEPLFRFAAQVDALAPLTQRSADWFSSGLGENAPVIRPMPNSLPDGYRPRASLDEKAIICLRRLVPEKQVEHAIEAFALVLPDHPEWELRIFGQGPDLPKLRRLAQSLEVQDRVRFYGPTSHVAEEFAKASISLLPSKIEAWGLVIIESWGAGVPVVSYDCPTGPGEVITDGVDGLLVPADDAHALADGMRRLMEDPDTRHRMGRAGLESVKRYSTDAVVAEWEVLYENVLAARRAPGYARAKADRVAAHRASTGGMGFAPAVAPGERQLADHDINATEQQWMTARPELVRSGGRVSLVSDRMTPADVRDANLQLVADALTGAGEPFTVLRGSRSRHRVMVTADRFGAALRTLADRFEAEPVYVEQLDARGKPGGVATAGALPTMDRSGVSGFRVFRQVVTPSGTMRMGPRYGCDVEVWGVDAESGTLQPPPSVAIGHALSPEAQRRASCRVGEREYPTFEHYTRDDMDDVTFPIDVVYSWVDADDPKWRLRKAEAMGLSESPRQAREGASSSTAAARFRSRDELRYSLRSLSMFAPWVRHVYVVTDDQRPEWLNTEHPGITVVDHREIFPRAEFLPNFNSHAIGSCLHRIEGLAEHFLYFNDDVFLGKPLGEKNFFLSNGLAKHFPSPTVIPFGPPEDPQAFHFLAGQNVRRLFEKEFGRTLVHSFKHTPHALRRSVLAEMEERWSDEFARTRSNQFRRADDLQIASTAHHYYAYLTGRSVPGKLSSGYLDVGRRQDHPLLTQLLTKRDRDVFCLNDTHDSELPANVQEAVLHAFLENYFPIRSPYERVGCSLSEPRSPVAQG